MSKKSSRRWDIRHPDFNEQFLDDRSVGSVFEIQGRPVVSRAALQTRAPLRVRACQVLAAVLWQSQNENPARGFNRCGECQGRGSGTLMAFLLAFMDDVY